VHRGELPAAVSRADDVDGLRRRDVVPGWQGDILDRHAERLGEFFRPGEESKSSAHGG
jgi:hypothetical protein